MFKKISKRLLVGLLILSILFSFSGCLLGSSEEEVTTDPQTIEEQIAQSEFLYPETNEDFRYNKYTYYVAITQCLSLKSNIVIPDTIANLPVYVINSGAFKNQTTIKTVSISDNVITIGDNAFANCSQLTSVKLPANLTTLGSSAFSDCDSLKNIEIPNTVATISDSLCAGCDSLVSVIIDEPEVVSVDEETGAEVYTTARLVSSSAFSNCPSLEYIWFPSDASFDDNDPLSGSLENLNIYGYSQSSAASYAANNFVSFTLVQNKSQLTEFKSLASQVSKIQIINSEDGYKGEEVDVQIENVYIYRNDLKYEVRFTDEDRKAVTNEFTYTPATGSEVAIFGMKIKNNTSRDISFNDLSASIKIDTYTGRFASFGILQDKTVSKYSTPAYFNIGAGETSYVYFASIINNEWSDIVITLGNVSELANCEFTIKNTDNITYIGSANSAIDDNDDTETTTATTETETTDFHTDDTKLVIDATKIDTSLASIE